MTIKGEDIKKYRKSNKLSQTKMAKMIGVSPRTIQNYEAGNTIPESKQSLLQGILHKNHDDENTDGKERHGKDSNNENIKNTDNEEISARSGLNDSITDYTTKDDCHSISPPEHKVLLIKAINRMAEAIKTASEAFERNIKTFETIINQLIENKELTIHEANEIISKLNDRKC